MTKNYECNNCPLPDDSISVAFVGPLKEMVLELAEYYGVECGDVVVAGIKMMHKIMEDSYKETGDEN